MEKPVAVIEFGSKKIKLVVGFEIDGLPYVLYATTKPYGNDIDFNEAYTSDITSSLVSEMRDFSDNAAKLKLTVSEALLSIPPFGLEIYDNQQITTVISPENKVENIDIRNIYALIRNGASSLQNELINIIPDSFILDQGRSFTNPPLGEVSSTLTANVKVHTLPKQVLFQYSNAVKNGGISVYRTFVASHGAIELLKKYPEVPDTYLLLDIGSDVTTLSLVGNNSLFASKYFDWGGDNITEKIVEAFNINPVEAEKIKITYGIDPREMNFKAPICKVRSADGNLTNHYSDELNNVIKDELENFEKQYRITLAQLLEGYEPQYKSLPLVMIGGGSQLVGLVDYISSKFDHSDVMVVTPKTLGARNATFTNCLGMIVANSKYQTVYDESRPKMGNLTREEIVK